MQHRIVPDDNSCLFSSLGIVFKGGFSDSISRELRQSEFVCFGANEYYLTIALDNSRGLVVAEEIRKDEIEYPEVVLG